MNNLYITLILATVLGVIGLITYGLYVLIGLTTTIIVGIVLIAVGVISMLRSMKFT